MTSLTQRMEELQKQQAILAEKIKQEEIMNDKLAQEASIERLEALIQPLTQHLDWVDPKGVRSYYVGHPNMLLSARQHTNKAWEHINICNNSTNDAGNIIIKIKKYPILANEEIFVTLIGILKKQAKKINDLEYKVENTKPHFVNSKSSSR